MLGKAQQFLLAGLALAGLGGPMLGLSGNPPPRAVLPPEPWLTNVNTALLHFYVKNERQKFLDTCKQHAPKPGKTAALSYAWPTTVEETPIQDFLCEFLAPDLTRSGIHTVLDKTHLLVDISAFMASFDTKDVIFVVGTPTFLQKYNQETPVKNNVQKEAEYWTKKHKKNPSSVIPLIFCGQPEEALPKILEQNLHIQVGDPRDYFTFLTKFVKQAHGWTAGACPMPVKIAEQELHDKIIEFHHLTPEQLQKLEQQMYSPEIIKSNGNQPTPQGPKWGKILVFFGPTAAGKTTTIHKLIGADTQKVESNLSPVLYPEHFILDTVGQQFVKVKTNNIRLKKDENPQTRNWRYDYIPAEFISLKKILLDQTAAKPPIAFICFPCEVGKTFATADQIEKILEPMVSFWGPEFLQNTVLGFAGDRQYLDQSSSVQEMNQTNRNFSTAAAKFGVQLQARPVVRVGKNDSTERITKEFVTQVEQVKGITMPTGCNKCSWTPGETTGLKCHKEFKKGIFGGAPQCTKCRTEDRTTDGCRGLWKSSIKHDVRYK